MPTLSSIAQSEPRTPKVDMRPEFLRLLARYAKSGTLAPQDARRLLHLGDTLDIAPSIVEELAADLRDLPNLRREAGKLAAMTEAFKNHDAEMKRIEGAEWRERGPLEHKLERSPQGRQEVDEALEIRQRLSELARKYADMRHEVQQKIVSLSAPTSIARDASKRVARLTEIFGSTADAERMMSSK